LQLDETPFDDSLRVEGELTLKSNGKLIELSLPKPHEVGSRLLMIPHLGLTWTIEYVRIAKNSMV